MDGTFLQFVDLAIKVMFPVLTAILAFFWAEVKDLRKKNEELQKDMNRQSEHFQTELSRVREEFVSLETLRTTEERITHYFDRRLGDMVEKLGSRLDMVVQLMKRDN